MLRCIRFKVNSRGATANFLQQVVPPARLRAAEMVAAAARDIDTARIRNVIRQELREALLAAGIILPPPAPRPKRHGPPLRLVDK